MPPRADRRADVIRPRPWIVALVWLLPLTIVTSCQGQREAPLTAANDEANSTAKAVESIPVTDVGQLRQRVGKAVTVRGSVSRTGKSRSGIHFLNFAGTELTIVCRPEAAKKFEKPPSEQFKGQTVEVTGTLERYKGKLQITLDGPTSIKVADPADPARGPPAITLEKLGEQHWKSPAGLHYKGRDPDGRSRLEHVLRHARDDPKRDGPHGVFLGGRDGALATIDEAWRLVRKRGTRPRTDGGRSAYTILLPRTVGYLGGRTGASRGKPKLQRVLIVVEKGTSNVVTAYPK